MPLHEDWEVTPREAARLLREGAVLIDVREESEWKTARVEGAILAPLGSLRERADDIEALDDADHVLVICHHGRRSLQGAAILREKGIAGAMSVAGGIDLWSVAVDAGVPRY
ncbi:MAG: rhodanese-like domain-containing protein [Phycisphaerales bacterium]|nr:rhodanese-like domain-containing protein [Phycisphaerales bacterium]